MPLQFLPVPPLSNSWSRPCGPTDLQTDRYNTPSHAAIFIAYASSGKNGKIDPALWNDPYDLIMIMQLDYDYDYV